MPMRLTHALPSRSRLSTRAVTSVPSARTSFRYSTDSGPAMVVPKCGRSPFCWAFRVEDDSRQPSRSRSFPGQLPVAAPPAPSCSSLRPSATAALGRSGHAMAGRAVRSGPWHAVAAPQVAKRLPSRQGSRGTASGPQSPGKRVGSLVREPLAGAQHNGGKSRVVGGVRQVLRFEAKRAVLAHADAPLLGQKVGRVKLHARLGGSNRHGPTGPGVRQAAASRIRVQRRSSALWRAAAATSERGERGRQQTTALRKRTPRELTWQRWPPARRPWLHLWRPQTPRPARRPCKSSGHTLAQSLPTLRRDCGRRGCSKRSGRTRIGSLRLAPLMIWGTLPTRPRTAWSSPGTQRHTPRRGKVHCPLGRHHAASGDQVLVCLHKVAAAKPQSVVCHAVASVISACATPSHQAHPRATRLQIPKKLASVLGAAPGCSRLAPARRTNPCQQRAAAGARQGGGPHR